MGRRTDHAITQVWLDLEDAPAETVNVRYEFRPQLVRLGVLRAAPKTTPCSVVSVPAASNPVFPPSRRARTEPSLLNVRTRAPAIASGSPILTPLAGVVCVSP